MNHIKVAISICLLLVIISPALGEYMGYDRVTIPYDNSSMFVPATGNQITYVNSIYAPELTQYRTAIFLESAPGNTTYYLVDVNNTPCVYTFQYPIAQSKLNTNSDKDIITAIMEAIGCGNN